MWPVYVASSPPTRPSSPKWIPTRSILAQYNQSILFRARSYVQPRVSTEILRIFCFKFDFWGSPVRFRLVSRVSRSNLRVSPFVLSRILAPHFSRKAPEFGVRVWVSKLFPSLYFYSSVRILSRVCRQFKFYPVLEFSIWFSKCKWNFYVLYSFIFLPLLGANISR